MRINLDLPTPEDVSELKTAYRFWHERALRLAESATPVRAYNNDRALRLLSAQIAARAAKLLAGVVCMAEQSSFGPRPLTREAMRHSPEWRALLGNPRTLALLRQLVSVSQRNRNALEGG